jgi:NTP pyrophosphatase (non-canonical NTP hydrolase)
VSARLSLLLSTPRIAPGLLSREAWSTLERAGQVLGRDADDPQLLAIEDAGVSATALGDVHPAELARLLVDRATEADVVWVGSSDGDPGLTDALAAEVSRRDDPPEVEMLVGSYDVPGSRLLDLVAVMDRLRSPGGCPWDAQQTHESLVPYLLEEAHEAVEAIESGDRAHMAEELGDVLLQVVFHARVAQEHPDAPFGIDDVAGGIVEKLVRRHPHVFADVDADTAAEVSANWEQIKAEEKAGRTSALDGIPAGLPALARADKAASRLHRAGLSALAEQAAGGTAVGARLMALVLEARGRGEDPEAALRAVVRALEQAAAGAGR